MINFIGNNLKSLRKSKGLTLQELGSKVNLTPQAISQYERSIREPDKKTLKKIYKALGTTVEKELHKNIIFIRLTTLFELMYSVQGLDVPKGKFPNLDLLMFSMKRDTLVSFFDDIQVEILSTATSMLNDLIDIKEACIEIDKSEPNSDDYIHLKEKIDNLYLSLEETFNYSTSTPKGKKVKITLSLVDENTDTEEE